MKLRTAILTLCLPALAIAAGSTFALQGHDDPMGGFEFPKPTEQHEWLHERVGDWNCTVSMEMLGAPTKAKEVVQAFGDFWIVADFEGSMMGMDFKGKSLMTYDPTKEKFVSTWCDTTMPSLTVMEGTLDESGQVLTSKGMSPNMTGEMVEWTSVLELKSDDHSVFRMYESSLGADTPTAMTIEYRRAQ